MAPRNSININNILKLLLRLSIKMAFNELTLTSLAQKLEIRSPSLYNHFNGLSGLRSLLSVYGFQQLNQVLMRAAIGRSGDDAIRAMAKAYINFARSHPGLYEVTLSEPTSPEALQVSEEIVELVTQVLRAYQLDDATSATYGSSSAQYSSWICLN